MYARSTDVMAQSSMIEAGIKYVEDQVMPALLSIEGCVGLSMMVDHSTGRCITTSAWDSAEAMRASGPQVQPLRDQYVANFSGQPPMVNEWEVAIMHRDHPSMPGACARTSWLQGNPMTIDDSTDAFRSILSTLEDLPGFCSASLLVNRESGRAASTVTYDSADALMQTRAPANTLRTRVAQQSGADVLEIAEFQLAVAHLRVPELV